MFNLPFIKRPEEMPKIENNSSPEQAFSVGRIIAKKNKARKKANKKARRARRIHRKRG